MPPPPKIQLHTALRTSTRTYRGRKSGFRAGFRPDFRWGNIRNRPSGRRPEYVGKTSRMFASPETLMNSITGKVFARNVPKPKGKPRFRAAPGVGSPGWAHQIPSLVVARGGRCFETLPHAPGTQIFPDPGSNQDLRVRKPHPDKNSRQPITRIPCRPGTRVYPGPGTSWPRAKGGFCRPPPQENRP